MSEYHKKYYLKNRERLMTMAREYYQKNKHKIKPLSRERTHAAYLRWKNKHGAAYIAARAEKRRNDPEYRKKNMASVRAWEQKNAEYCRKKARIYRANRKRAKLKQKFIHTADEADQITGIPGKTRR